MKIIDPAIASLATAKSLLLDPWGLTEADMARALGEIFTHKVDYADLYFQYTRSEGWSLEEGIVKTGSFSISQGVGVRAVSGEKTAFAYSDSLSADALLSSAHAVRGIARRGAGKVKVAAQVEAEMGRSLYADIDPVATLSAPEKVALLERIERMARARDPHVIQVMAGLGAEYDVVLVPPGSGRAAAGAPVADRHRRTQWPPRNGSCRRRRPPGAGVFHRRNAAGLRRARRA
jgi:TldD protein